MMFLILTVLLIAGSAAAQTQFGSISGRVTDASGAVVPQAKVTITNIATNAKQSADSNEEGLFVLANVSAGTYDISVEKTGFKKITSRLTLAIAQRVDLDFKLELGQITEVITVTESALILNTISGEISNEIPAKDLENLPLLTRDPYALIALSAGASDTGSTSGDVRGRGLAVYGARTSSINYMLDGGENNDTFVAGLGQTVPLDAVQEMKVQTNSTTAEFGRNMIVTNVVTKGGSNEFHGSIYEFYRGSALSSSTFDDNAKGIPKSNFVRNQFGASGGGRLIKDRLFFFGSFEGQRVRSAATSQFFVPTTAFGTAASANTNAFLSAFGGIPTSNCSDLALTAQDIVVGMEGAPAYTGNELLNANTGAIIPATTQLFCRTTLKRPADSGGGIPQNTWLATGRIDWRISDASTFFGRYAFSQSNFFAGSNSFSPYQGFNTGTDTRNQNLNLTLTHSFSPRLFSETRAIYNRIFSLQPLGSAPATTPCWQYDLFNATPTGDLIVFPGYVPDVCSFAGIPFGGPQNIYQVYEGLTYARGKHTVKWGGQYLHMRDNRAFGAYENAYFDTFSMQGMLDGNVDFIFAAIDPKGKVPGDVYDPAAAPVGDGPYQFPSFTRHFHYNELAFYAEDSWKVTPRVTLTAGLRWEYFGVPHSPSNEKFLDANLYLDAVGTVPPLTGTKSIYEQVRDARFLRTNQFYRADYNNFAPRLGVAWDLFGDSRTVLRAGYGIYYDRNFGNAVFNAIQNPPNYAVVSLGVSAPINANQFNTLASGGATTISSSARMLNNDMPTAYAQQWNATVEHDILGKGIIVSLSYIGTKGDKLYSLNNLNQRGACLLLVAVVPGSACTPGGGNSSRINQTGLTGMNRRGNEGMSRYHGMSLEAKTRQLANTGLSVRGNYTWSHSIDNEASFFADSTFEGLYGFGFRDAYNPALDKASSTNDSRHRASISGVWDIPWGKNLKGFAGQALDGWTITGIFTAQTGTPFSVYDGSTNQCNNSLTNFCLPVLTGSAIPGMTATAVSGNANTFTLYDLGNTNSVFQTQEAFCAANSLNSPLGPLTGLDCTAVIANLRADLTSPRNLFRTPGIWNVDGGIYKTFRLPWEGHRLQFRAEFFNLFNHSNLYADPSSNLYTGSTTSNTVLAHRGVLPTSPTTYERRNIQLALRYTF
jgi:outer membrane receptor protein involved in Fe transport